MKPVKFGDIDHRIVSAANDIGATLFSHEGEVWLNGEYQLTYRAQTVDGVTKTLTDDERTELAVNLLKDIKDSRMKWPGVPERFAAVVAGLEETIPHYAPRTYTYYRDASLDKGWMIRTAFSGDCDMGVELVGLPTVRVEGATFEQCITKLRSHSLMPAAAARGEE